MGSSLFSRRSFGILALAVATLAALTMSACASSLSPGDPALPPGFADAPLPDVELGAYLYAAQGQPVGLPRTHFAGNEVEDELEALQNEESAARDLSVWVGLSSEQLAGRLHLADEGDAQLLEEILQRRLENAPLWVSRQGQEVNLARGDEAWRNSIADALAQGSTATLAQGYPDIWELVRLLPEEPPLTPVAAGFMDLDLMSTTLAERAQMDTQALRSAVSALRVETAAYGVYVQESLRVPEKVTPQTLKETGIATVIVTSSGYPGFLLGFLFGNFAGRADLSEVDLESDGTAFYREVNGLHLLVRNAGNTVVFVLAADRADAEAMLRSTIP